MMDIVITAPHFQRPDYSNRSVSSIAENPDASEFHYHASVDASPYSDDVVSVIRSYGRYFKGMSINVRTCKPSCNGNVKAALQDATGMNPDFVIIVEDDVLFGRDALTYFKNQAVIYENDKSVLNVSAWIHPDGWLPGCGRDIMLGEDQAVGYAHWFTPWGWGTWPDRLSEILEKWTTGTDHGNGDEDSWDRVLGMQVRGDRVQVQPMVSRAINIGKEKGTHRGDFLLPYWIETKHGS